MTSEKRKPTRASPPYTRIMDYLRDHPGVEFHTGVVATRVNANVNSAMSTLAKMARTPGTGVRRVSKGTYVYTLTR
jgi:hypothetical protein